MKLYGSWIALEEGEIIPMLIAQASIKQVFKHWIQERNRSYLCTGDTCGFCQGGKSRRSRYTCIVIIEGANYQWEYGDDIARTLSVLQPLHGYYDVNVARLGSAGRTSYQLTVRVQPPATPSEVDYNAARLRANDKYTSGRHGHVVRR